MILSYLRYLWQSTNAHGVHSPFVYEFVTRGLYAKKLPPEFFKIHAIRKELLQNNKKLSIEDYGAGSKIFKNNQRTIGQLAKYVALSPKKATILFKVISYFKPEYILELGTSIGLGTTTLAYANPKAKIVTIEGCQNIYQEAKKLFAQENLQQINSIHSTFDTFIKGNDQLFDCILFDGHHTFEATIRYFEYLLHAKHNHSLWIFDDIHWSEDMEKAWHVIKNHPEVSVTIDLFHYGLVFFRKEQQKEHFVIRV